MEQALETFSSLLRFDALAGLMSESGAVQLLLLN